jgi:D-serine deaminase-like pyridoxal phosphate-dependent protein
MILYTDEIETPALIIDLEIMERNIAKMSEFFKDKEAKLRPHAKTHKCPAIAHKQLEAGARGVCCQKLSEAEIMINAGIKDVLITNQVVGATKIRKLVGLSRHGCPIVAVDDLEVAKQTSETALEAGTCQDVVIEVDVGIERCGKAPGKPTLEFAREIVKLKGLNLRGLMGYEGPFFNIVSFEERKNAANKRNKLLVDTAELLRKNGIDVEIVSAGATGTYNITGAFPGITEVEAGSYVFMDTYYLRLENLGFESSLTLLSTVISTPVPGRAIIDSGMKAITNEFGMPKVKGIEGAELVSLSEEHGKLKIPDSARLKVGDKIEIIPSHCCTTCNLHEQYYGVRRGKLEVVWPIAARGKIF